MERTTDTSISGLVMREKSVRRIGMGRIFFWGEGE